MKLKAWFASLFHPSSINFGRKVSVRPLPTNTPKIRHLTVDQLREEIKKLDGQKARNKDDV